MGNGWLVAKEQTICNSAVQAGAGENCEGVHAGTYSAAETNGRVRTLATRLQRWMPVPSLREAVPTALSPFSGPSECFRGWFHLSTFAAGNRESPHRRGGLHGLIVCEGARSRGAGAMQRAHGTLMTSMLPGNGRTLTSMLLRNER
jgi:hypothetical protein